MIRYIVFQERTTQMANTPTNSEFTLEKKHSKHPGSEPR